MAESGHLTLQQTADLLKVTRATVSIYCKNGRLASVTRGRRRYVPEGGAVAMLEPEAQKLLMEKKAERKRCRSAE